MYVNSPFVCDVCLINDNGDKVVLIWVDANIAHRFGLRIQDSGLPKIRLKFPSMISGSLYTPSCAAHRPCFAASLTWSSMRATKGDTITFIALPDFGLPRSRWWLVTGNKLNFSQNLSGVGPQHHLHSKMWTKHSSCSGFSWQTPGIFSTTERIASRVSF